MTEINFADLVILTMVILIVAVCAGYLINCKKKGIPSCGCGKKNCAQCGFCKAAAQKR